MSASLACPRLLHQRDRLLAAARALEDLTAGAYPGSENLARARWNFTREMLLHFSHVDTMVLHPMMADRRTLVAATAARSSHDLRATYDQFRRHAARWAGLPDPKEWSAYRDAVRLLIRRIRVRLAGQDQQIYPLLPVQPGGVRIAALVEPVQYAAEAWKIRALIYADTPARSARSARG